MNVILAVVVLLGADVKSDLNQPDKYFLNCNNPATEYWIENSQHQKIADLARYEIYQTSQLHTFVYESGPLKGQRMDNGQRVRLYSKQGFTLDNIPTYAVRFYNEGIEIFLLAEKLLPKTYQCLKNNKYQTREINTCQFHMPFNPYIHSKIGDTRFKVNAQGGWIEVWGVASDAGADEAQVTLSGGNGNDADITVLHEYIHMCGYGNEDHDKLVFKCARQNSETN